MLQFLSRGTETRATRSTNMNSQSSYSHAVFTILMEQWKNNGDVLSAKFHLVDLAGFGRGKKTGEYRLRSKEDGNINKDLLALGKVISAFSAGDVKKRKRKEGDHVPYRDSNLTRLLQDSFGGNTKTLMIACICPSDTNAEETIITLKYANLARNIQNKAVVNRLVTTEMHSVQMLSVENDRLRSLAERLQTELVRCRGGGQTSEEPESERRRNEYKKPKLLALKQRKKMIDEATMATERLKELLEAIKVSREIYGPGNANPSEFQALMQTIEHELEVKVRVHEVRTKYERQMKERVAMEKEVTELKEEAEIDCPQTSARNIRLSELQNMLEMLSSTLVSMDSQFSKAKELEREFEGRGRWNQVQSLSEAQNVMNYLFDSVSSSRCQLRDKDLENTKLKEKLVKHCSLVRKLTELHGQEDSDSNQQIVRPDPSVECGCSRMSTCKSKKCMCHKANRMCRASCFCNAKKCSKRQG